MSSFTAQFNLREDIAGTPGNLLNNSNPLNIGDRFFAQVLMGDIRSGAVGLIGSAINVNFEAAKIKNIDIPFNPVDLNSPLLTPNFPLFRDGTLNNTNGTITNLGGAAFTPLNVGSPLGVNQLEQFSLMYFEVTAKGSTNLTLNVDLNQTTFDDGTLANSTDQSQFIQTVPIVPADNPLNVPEPTPSITLLMVIIAYVSLSKLLHLIL